MDESNSLERDQDLRTSTLVRHRPIRGQSHFDFLGESEGSLPPLHDSFPDAGERTNDFWSMSIASVQKQNLSWYRRIYKSFLSRKSFMLIFLRSSAKLVKSFPADWGRRFGEPLIGSMILSGRWLSIIQKSPNTSEVSNSLVGKFCQESSWEMFFKGGCNLERSHYGRRHWGARKFWMFEDSMRRRFSCRKMWTFDIPDRKWTSQVVWKRLGLPLCTWRRQSNGSQPLDTLTEEGEARRTITGSYIWRRLIDPRVWFFVPNEG